MAGEISIVAIVKGEERYVFMFDDDTRAETLRTLGRFASNPELSFSWYDAAVLSQKVRKTQKTAPSADLQGPHFQDGTFKRKTSPVSHDELHDVDSFPDLDFPEIDDIWIGDDPVG